MSGIPGNADVPVGMNGNNADGDVGAPRKFPWPNDMELAEYALNYS